MADPRDNVSTEILLNALSWNEEMANRAFKDNNIRDGQHFVNNASELERYIAHKRNYDFFGTLSEAAQ